MRAHIVLATLFFSVLLCSCSSPPDVKPGQCHPCTVSAAVGPLLKDAQQMIAAKDYEGATAKLNQADGVKSNPDDEIVIAQFRHVIATCSAANRPNLAPSQPRPN